MSVSLRSVAATTKCVVRAGNPSSSHYFGRAAKEGLEQARRQVAASIGCSPGEIFFTSGGTEANNWALKGAVYASRRALQDHFTQSMGGSALAWSSMYVDQLRPHVITTAVEHPAVLEPLRWLQREQLCDVSIVPVGPDGVARVQDIVDELRSQTVMVSVMHANNEIGAVQPVAEISAAVKQWAYDFGERGKMGLTSGILIHSDACQSLGKIDVDVNKLKVDLLSIAGHKLYAPKGVGALYIKGGVAGPAATGSAFLSVDDEREAEDIAARDNNSEDYLMKLLHGAGQESGLRASTENVALCVGLGAACDMLSEGAERERERQAALVARFVATRE
jgi:cysteine desulfurase